MNLTVERPADERGGIRLAGALLVGGFLINAIATMGFHPSGSEDDHEQIFMEYVESSEWIWIHVAQFVGGIVALGGLVVLYRVLRDRGGVSLLATFALASTIVTAATLAILQAQDGVALKHSVDAWAAAPSGEESARFADAETLRWLEWGLQSYFRMMLGLALGLFGAAIIVSRLLSSWVGWVGVLAGALSIAVGFDVGYQGLESGLQDVAVPATQLALLVFSLGMLVAGGGRQEAAPAG